MEKRTVPYKEETFKIEEFKTTNGYITKVPDFMVPIMKDMTVYYNDKQNYLQFKDRKELTVNNKKHYTNKKFSFRATRDISIRILNLTLEVQITDLNDLTDSKLEIHHLDEDPLNNDPKNLMLLTHKTHQQTREKSDSNENKNKCKRLKQELRDIRDRDISRGKRFFEYFDIDESKLVYLTKDKDYVCKTKIDYENKFDINILGE